MKYRAGGRLDEYIGEDQVNAVLRRCAFRLVDAGGGPEAEKAVLLYQLAGCHADAIHELCRQLAHHLKPAPFQAASPFHSAVKASSNKSAARDFWRRLSEQFIEEFLRGGVVSNAIQHALAASQIGRGPHQMNGLVLVDSLRSLLAILSAMDLSPAVVGAGDCKAANRVLEILDSMPLKLLPQHDEQVAAAVDLRLHESVSAVLDDVLLLAMRSVKNLFEQTRQHRRLSTGNCTVYGSISISIIYLCTRSQQASQGPSAATCSPTGTTKHSSCGLVQQQSSPMLQR
jgi:hypothetical protein